MGARKKVALVGVGGRHFLFQEALLGKYCADYEIVGFCDTNPGRLAYNARKVQEAAGLSIPAYAAADFDRMLQEGRPQLLIITPPDCFHEEYICRGLEAGCDVITEKPMTIDAGKCRRILETQRRTGRSVRVCFNYRYSPPRTQVKELLMSGVIGDILSVDFHWMLDIHHGADYFRRWHRNKRNSGGLMVHKATHHFDLVNWWLSTVPEEVFAMGQRRFYTPQTADRFGLTRRGERCRECAEAGRCRFYLNLDDGAHLKGLYLDAEQYDGYYRDRCVFAPDIDIEDSMQVLIRYRSGARMSYSLNAFCPWEGYVVTFNGILGRLEHKCEERVYINADGSVPGALKKEGTSIRVFPTWKSAYAVDVWTGEGGHGGGDDVMLDDIFRPGAAGPDRYLRAADQRAGAYSILCGVAANESIRTGKMVRIADLVPGIGDPEDPRMPDPMGPLVMPPPDASATVQ